jgi:hypothetical protein
MLRHVTIVRTDVSEERRLVQESHGVTSQKPAFFIVTAVKTSNRHSINRLGSVVEMYCVSYGVQIGVS